MAQCPFFPKFETAGKAFVIYDCEIASRLDEHVDAALNELLRRWCDYRNLGDRIACLSKRSRCHI